ncbi:hypothetical protein KRP22_008365 [Phytophthora ramorum]|nr:hypothetical protein KRP22_3622 [Phytophthora ramorum]
MISSRRQSRNGKRKPSSSRKLNPPPIVDFSMSISSVSSEPTPILESSLSSSYQKHVLRRHHQNRGSRRHGASARGVGVPRDSPFTPRRPVGAVPELFVTFRHVSLAVDVPVSPAAAQAASGQMGRETLAAKQLPTITNHVRGILGALTDSKTRRHPRSANEFADLWIMSPMYEAMVEELDHLDNDTETYGQMHSKNVYVVSMLLSYVMLEYCRHEAVPTLPPPLPTSLSDTAIPTPRQPKESYAMLATPHGDEDELLESDLTDFQPFGDPNDLAVLDEDDDSNDSFNASQGVCTNPEEIMVHLTPQWDVQPVTLAFQDLRYSIMVPAAAVTDPTGQSGIEGAPGRPVAVDSRANAGKNKEMVTRELLKGVTGYALPAYKASRLKQRLDAKRAAPGVFMPSDRLPPVTFAQRRAASDGLQFAMLMRSYAGRHARCEPPEALKEVRFALWPLDLTPRLDTTG